MDISKYIGLFLLKNQFCYVHGLGNLELIKRPGKHEGGELQAPHYEVIVTQSGSIDDNLANFIATNEQISISKAANALREFSGQARMDMAAGKEVPITNVGKFIEEKGRVKFITDDNFRFTPAGIPTIKNSKQLDEQNTRLAHKPAYPPPTKADSVNWSMVVLAVVLLLIVGGGIYGIYYYTMRDKKTTEVSTIIPDTANKPAPVVVQPPAVTDTSKIKKDSVTATPPPAAIDSNAATTYKMVIGDYPTKARAEKRQSNLKLNGTVVDILPKDSTNYLIIATINCKARDTTHVMDSLHRMFGFKGVAILR